MSENLSHSQPPALPLDSEPSTGSETGFYRYTEARIAEARGLWAVPALWAVLFVADSIGGLAYDFFSTESRHIAFHLFNYLLPAVCFCFIVRYEIQNLPKTRFWVVSGQLFIRKGRKVEEHRIADFDRATFCHDDSDTIVEVQLSKMTRSPLIIEGVQDLPALADQILPWLAPDCIFTSLKRNPERNNLLIYTTLFAALAAPYLMLEHFLPIWLRIGYLLLAGTCGGFFLWRRRHQPGLTTLRF